MDDASTRRELVILGVIGRPRGLAGHVYVKASNPDSSLWKPGTTLLLAPPARDSERDGDTFVMDVRELSLVTIESSGRGAKKRLIVSFLEISERDAAEQLNRWRVVTDRELLETPDDPDEFWLVEMPGWTVSDESGESLGLVVATLQTNIDLLEVRPSRGAETFYIPMIKDVVVRLDRTCKTVVIRRLQGLVPGDTAT